MDLGSICSSFIYTAGPSWAEKKAVAIEGRKLKTRGRWPYLSEGDHTARAQLPENSVLAPPSGHLLTLIPV